MSGKEIGEKRYFKSFFDFGKEIFKLLPKKPQQSCQNSILRIQRMNPRQEFVFGSTEFSILPDFEQNFSERKR